MRYETVIGLEVHAELNTNTKIYCGCQNKFGAEVNANCCPICTGMPGTLPVLNEKVVEYAVKMGHALNCTIHPVSKQDRKHYFYPDLPKAYQTSQFDIPLCENGFLDVMTDEEGNTKRIGVTRIHIEEDAGKLLHDDSFAGSLVDFNRCGVPLIEIVSEPDMRSSAEAKAYLETIRSILLYLDISDGKMQEGSIRCDINVSVRKEGEALGTRCEMKNVNSFSAAVRAIDYEAARQISVLESGGTIAQETRRWDDVQGKNFLLRSKEDAHDYRYFPEPDLLTLVVPEEKIKALKETLPELPNQKRMRYMKSFDLSHYDANLLVENMEKAAFFECCVQAGSVSPKNIANWLLGDVTRILNEKSSSLSETKLTAEKLVDMIGRIESGEISTTAGKTVLEEIIFSDKTPQQVIGEQNLAQISDSSALEEIVKTVLAENAKSVADYKNGKSNAVGFLVGQCMRKSAGQANPAMVRELLVRFLDEE